MGTGPYMLGPWVLVHGYWSIYGSPMGTGPYMVGPWDWSMGTGPWVLVHGYWPMGLCPYMVGIVLLSLHSN